MLNWFKKFIEDSDKFLDNIDSNLVQKLDKLDFLRSEK
jgi:hypothetical protein